MKQTSLTFILAMVLMLIVSTPSANAQKVVLHMTGNKTFECNISELDSISFVDAEEHEWVDLGLPSGTLWATCNVGANSPEEYGDYFAWGETKPKEEYSWSTYIHSNGSHITLTKYCTHANYGYNGFVDNLTELLPEDDAATANWGSDWQMPSLAQCEELINSSYTTTTWVTENGVYGRKIISKDNGKSIFLPATGVYMGARNYSTGLYGYYFSRSLNTGNTSCCSCIDFDSGGIGMDGSSGSREYGRTVRPVRVNKINNEFCNLPARLIIENVLQAPVLFVSCESMGEYCTIKSDGQRILITNAAGNTDIINIIGEQHNYYLGLSGLIIGKLSIPEIGEDRLRVVCFDCACPNCYQNYNITKPLVLQTTGYANCNNCGRTYNLNDCGTISDGPAGSSLYRYRVSYIGNTLIINND